MPQSRCSNLSEESYDALLEALGLSPIVQEEPKNASLIGSMGTSYVDVSNDGSYSQRPKTPTYSSGVESPSFDDEASVLQNYLSDFDISSDFDEDSGEELDDFPPSRPESSIGFEMIGTPVARAPIHREPIRLSHPLASAKFHLPNPNSPTRPAHLSTYDTDSPPPSPSDAIYIKAAHNAAIIMLRAPRNISFADLKQRLYRKFVHQEGILLTHSFSVVNVLPPSGSSSTLRATSSLDATKMRPSSASSAMNRVRSESSASAYDAAAPQRPTLGVRRISFAERTEMRFITREADWRKIVSVHTQGSKITLRILDTPA